MRYVSKDMANLDAYKINVYNQGKENDVLEDVSTVDRHCCYEGKALAPSTYPFCPSTRCFENY